MKSKLFTPVFISLFSIALTFSFLINSEYAWLSVISFSVLCVSLSILLIYQNAILLTLFFIILNHFVFIEGISIIRFLVPAIAIFLTPFLIFLIKPINFKSILFSIILVFLYYVVIFLVKPFPIKMGWVFLHLESLLFFVFIQFFNWDLKKIIQVISLHLLFFIIYGIAESIFSDVNRIRGPMRSATGYGFLLVVIWSIWFSYNLLKKERNIVLLFLGSLITFLVILLTGTRMALVGVVIASFCISVILVLTSSLRPLLKTIILILTPFLLFVFFLITWTIVPDDFAIKKSFEILLSGKIDGSNLGRIIGWIGAMEAFSVHPFFGIGNGNFLAFLEKFVNSNGINPGMLGTSLVPHAHNLYLIILSENGLFGFFIILFIFLSAVYNYIRFLKKEKSKEKFCLLVGLLVLCTLCLFDSVPFYPPTQAWGAWFLGSLFQISSKESYLNTSDSVKSIPNFNSDTQYVQEIL